MDQNINKKYFSAKNFRLLWERSPGKEAFTAYWLCYSPDSYYFCALKIKRQIHTQISNEQNGWK